MNTRQPLYSFGEVFTREDVAEWKGQKHKVISSHKVVAIQAVAETNDFYYQYKLGSDFPRAYQAPAWTSDWFYETELFKAYPLTVQKET